jgi:DNA-binding NarL/FixJ family response regulator
MERYRTESIVTTCAVLVVDRWPIVRYGIKHILETKNDPTWFFQIIGATDASDALKRLQKEDYQVVLLDDQIQIGGAPLLVREMLEIRPDLRILGMGDKTNALLVESVMEAGAVGYLQKNISIAELVQALRATFNGDHFYSCSVANQLLEESRRQYQRLKRAPVTLSRREMQVLVLIAEGKTSKAMCEELLIGTRTVETHRKNLFRKMGVKNAPSLIKLAHDYNLLV